MKSSVHSQAALSTSNLRQGVPRRGAIRYACSNAGKCIGNRRDPRNGQRKSWSRRLAQPLQAFNLALRSHLWKRKIGVPFIVTWKILKRSEKFIVSQSWGIKPSSWLNIIPKEVDGLQNFPGLARVADSQNIPRASMVAGTLLLVCTFSGNSWSNGVGRHIEALILHLKAMGASGTNKTGATNYINFVFKQVRNALGISLVSLHNDSARCIEEGVQVNKQAIPEADNQAAIIKKNSQVLKKNSEVRCLMANFDEHANGSGGGMQTGLQYHLTT